MTLQEMINALETKSLTNDEEFVLSCEIIHKQSEMLKVAENRLECIRKGLERAKERLDKSSIGVSEYKLFDGIIQVLLPLTVIEKMEKTDGK